MDKNKSLYMTLVVVFCVLFAGVGGYFLGTYFGDRTTTKNEVKKVEEETSNKTDDDTSYKAELEKKKDDTLTNIVVYNFFKSGNKSFTDYLTNLDNNRKLEMASLDDKSTLKELKENLIKTYGWDLNLVGADYYLTNEDEIPNYFYDKETETFNYNYDFPGTDMTTNIGDTGIYNYKLKDISKDADKYIVKYYGLYETNFWSLGPTFYTNNKNIDRINYDNAKEFEYDDPLTVAEYLEKAFNNNKDDFFEFVYTYEKVNGNYVLVDFKQA